MGAWGYESFENDDALDWFSDLEESSDTEYILEALNTITGNIGTYIEAPEAAVAVAASELVAALNDNGASSLPEEVVNWAEGRPKPDPSLLESARQAVNAVLRDSELKELWTENAEEFPKWRAVLDDLLLRLS